MKIPPLPEIDLARIAPLPIDQKLNALERFRLGRPPFSYAPLRSNISDILNIDAGMFGAIQRTPWEKLAENIRKDARSEDEARANLAVAEGLYKYAEAMQLRGRQHDIFPLGFGVGRKVVFWRSVILTVEERPLVPFFDPRRSKSLTAEARRFVFSMMHERIRVADSDFAEVNLGIFQFTGSAKGVRTPILHTDKSISLFSFDELEEMVRETYEMWIEVYEDRVTKTRRAGGGGGGLL